MKNYLISFLLVFFAGFSITYAQYQPRNILTRNVSATEIKNIVKNLSAWRVTRKEEIMRELKNLSPSNKESLIKNGEKYVEFSWPALPAYNYLDFVRNGNRDIFQGKIGERRTALYSLVMAELIEGKGRFLPQIANGAWATCEESTWCWPAHISIQGKSGLPDPNQDIIDLGAGETAVNLSWVLFLMEDSLEKLSPVIPARVRFELNKRIIQPYLKIDFSWMGFPEKKVNNWNVWINRNCLYTIALTEKNDPVAEKSIQRILRSTDNFINSYGEDGGCEEGTHYWEEASGHLIGLLDLLKEISNGHADFSQEPLIAKMGQYIYKLHINEGYYVDFADASPRPNLQPAFIYMFGKTIRDSAMMQFASYLAARQNFAEILSKCNHLYNYFTNLQVYHDLLATPPKAPYVKEAWFPDLQLMTARDNEKSTEGFFIAAKAGNNGVSHGHNDVGNFIVYVDGHPAIIDVGVGTYTAQTFNSKRYDIWTMQSAWHNLPTINGVQQEEGSKYKADLVSFSANSKEVNFKADIANAYPEEAKVKSWMRSLTLLRGKKIVLNESYELKESKDPFTLSLMTPLNVKEENGKIILDGIADNGQKYGLVIRYNAQEFNVKTEIKLMDDETLKRNWGKELKRIVLESKKKGLKGSYTIEMEKYKG
jgi:hypothetical protein